MRKGILEYCILLILSRQASYASEIIAELKQAELIVVEGTLYPLLTRLKNSGLLTYSWAESTQGPPRKYYALNCRMPGVERRESLRGDGGKAEDSQFYQFVNSTYCDIEQFFISIGMAKVITCWPSTSTVACTSAVTSIFVGLTIFLPKLINLFV